MDLMTKRWSKIREILLPGRQRAHYSEACTLPTGKVWRLHGLVGLLVQLC